MVRLGLNTAVQSNGQGSSQSQSRTESRPSLTGRDTGTFSDFKQKWMSDRASSNSSHFDRQSALGSSRLTRSDRREVAPSLLRGKNEITGVDSALARLRDLRQQRETRTAGQMDSRVGLGLGSRSNLSLAERFGRLPFNKDQPTFQHRTTAASQRREIKQIARDGSIVTKVSETSASRQERRFASRSRAGSGPSVSTETFLKSRESTATTTEDNTSDLASTISSRLKNRKHEAESDNVPGQQDGKGLTAVEEKISHARQIIGLKNSRSGGNNTTTEKQTEASILLEKIKGDFKRKGKFGRLSGDGEENEGGKLDCVDAGRTEKETDKSCDNANSKNADENSIKNENDKAPVEEFHKESTVITKTTVMQASEEINEDSPEVESQSFERSRLIASRIFEKLESKRSLESKTKLGLQRKVESETSRKLEIVISDSENKREEKSPDNKTLHQNDHGNDGFEIKITKTKPISIPGFENHNRPGMESERKDSSRESRAQEKGNQNVTGIITGIGDKDNGTKLTPPVASLRLSPPVSPKPSPLVSPKPSPKSSIVLGNGDKITVAVELPDDDKNTQEDDKEEKGESSIEQPAQQSVATLRNSLFGSSSSSLEKMLSRGMGGTLLASPVVFRKKQVTERRQVMSSVEVTKNGMATMSMTQTFRMERKSESDATRNVDDAELLPTLYTRFEKPKKPRTAPKTKKTSLSPVTLSVKLSNNSDDSD